MELLYHNINCEFLKVEPGKTAYDLILSETDASCVNFELDSYWPTEAGVNALELMRKLDTRMKLYHINDRGTRLSKPAMTPILKSDQHGTRLWKHGSCFPDHAGRKSERGCSDLRKPQKLGGQFSVKVHGVKCRVYESVCSLVHSWKEETQGMEELKMHFITSDRGYREGEVFVYEQKFTVKDVKKAVFTATALGVYEAEINGVKNRKTDVCTRIFLLSEACALPDS